VLNSLLSLQIVAEFERILGVNSSILATFQYNFYQVCDQIITMAKEEKASKNKSEMGPFLGLLEDEYKEESSQSRLGKTFYHNSA